MFNLIDKSKGYLFASNDLYALIENQRNALKQEVEQMDANRLLNTSPTDLCQYLVDKYRLDPPMLRREDWSADEHETQIDVRNDPNRWISDSSHACLIPGQRVTVEVPFDGEAILFYARPSSISSMQPRAEIQKR